MNEELLCNQHLSVKHFQPMHALKGIYSEKRQAFLALKALMGLIK